MSVARHHERQRDEGRPKQYPGAYSSANLFNLIGQTAALGRGFGSSDDSPGAEPVVVLAQRPVEIPYAEPVDHRQRDPNQRRASR